MKSCCGTSFPSIYDPPLSQTTGITLLKGIAVGHDWELWKATDYITAMRNELILKVTVRSLRYTKAKTEGETALGDQAASRSAFGGELRIDLRKNDHAVLIAREIHCGARKRCLCDRRGQK